MPISKSAPRSSRTATSSTAARSGAGGWQPIHASDMIFIPDAGSAVMDLLTKLPTLSLTCDIVDAITKSSTRARSAHHRGQGRGLPQVDRHRDITAPSRSSSCSTRFATPRARTVPATWSIRSRGAGTPTARRGRTRLQAAAQGGYFPVPLHGHAARSARRHGDDAGGGGNPRRGVPPRSRDRRPVRAVDEVQQPEEDG